MRNNGSRYAEKSQTESQSKEQLLEIINRMMAKNVTYLLFRKSTTKQPLMFPSYQWTILQCMMRVRAGKLPGAKCHASSRTTTRSMEFE